LQVALARGLVAKVAGRAPGDPDRLAADTVLGTALLEQSQVVEAVEVFQDIVAAYHLLSGPASARGGFADVSSFWLLRKG
jgi:hypothetical protein